MASTAQLRMTLPICLPTRSLRCIISTGDEGVRVHQGHFFRVVPLATGGLIILAQAAELEMSGTLSGGGLLDVCVWPGGRVGKLLLLFRLVDTLTRRSVQWPSSLMPHLPVMMRHQMLSIW